MVIIYNKLIPFGRYTTINIFTMLFTKKKKLNEKILNHEKIHSVQMIEMAIVALLIMILVCFITKISYWWILLSLCSFYIWYCIEYIFVRFFHKKQNNAYHDISLEEEAYQFENDMEYLKNRKLFKWVDYLSIKSYKK